MKFALFLIIFGINIPIYKIIFNLMFDSKEDFYKSLRYVFTPDIISLFRGEYLKDWLGEMKFQFFILLCGGMIFTEYMIISVFIS